MAEDLSALAKGINDLNKSLKTLTAANLFNNVKMNDMVSASDKIRDDWEDISEFTNDTVKSLKEEETKLKANNALKKKQTEIEKKNFDIKQKELTIEQKQLEIKELEEKLARKTSTTEKKKLQIKIDGLKNEVQLTEKINDETRESIKLDEKECDIIKEQNKEYEKQLSLQKKQKTLLTSLGNDFKRLGSNVKNLLSGSIGKFLSAGMLIEGLKDAYEMSNKVYDSYWGLSVPLQKVNTGMGNLAKKTYQYNKALMDVKFTAARFGYDIDKIAPMMDTLQSKVKYLKKDLETGNFEWDIDRLADNAKQIIAISKKMNMESDDMITMLEERVRRFGDTNEVALNSMHEMAAATLTFNEIMGQGSVFTEEVGKHLMELHQNTKYWVQDFGMLNTMFNSHVNLLLKQGKHQKEALAIARQFQEGLQQPPDLIKWKAGTKLLGDIRSEIKNLNDEEAAKKIEETYKLTPGRGKTIVNALRHSKNTAFTNANFLQEELGGTMRGTEATIGAWKGFMGFDSTVLKDMGLASSVADAEKIKQLYKDLSKMNLSASTSMEEAIDKMVDLDKNLSEEERKAKREELKSLLNANKGEAGKEPESPFENIVLKTMKDFKAWLDNPLVKIAAGGVGALGGFFKETLSYLLGNFGSMLLMKNRGGIKNAVKSLPSKVKGSINANRAWNARLDRLKANSPLHMNDPFYEEKLGALKRRGISHKFARSMKGGLWSTAIGIGAGFLHDANDDREGITISNTMGIVSGLADIASKLNPWGLGISTLIGAVKGGFENNGNVIGSMADSLLAPLDTLTESTGKIFGKTSAIGKAMGYMNETIQESRRWWTNSKSPEQLQREAEEKRKKYANLNENLKAKRAAQFDEEYARATEGTFLEGQINSSNYDKLNDIYAGLEGEGWDTNSGALKELHTRLEKIRERQTAGEALSGLIDIQKIATMTSPELRAYAEKYKGLSRSNYGGEYGKFAGLETFAKERGWSAEKLQALRVSTAELARGFGHGDAGMMQAENIMLGKLQEAEAESQKTMVKQLQEQKLNREAAEKMQEYEFNIMKNSTEQSKYLNLIGQKAGLDMMRDRGTYENIYSNINSGSLKKVDGKWQIEGVESTVAATIANVFAS